MYNLYVKLVLLAVLAAAGISVFDVFGCHTRECRERVEARSRDILKVDWKPISVFPEEARRFRDR